MGAKQTAKPKSLEKAQEPCSDQRKLLKLFGTIDYDEAYDEKSERKRDLHHQAKDF